MQRPTIQLLLLAPGLALSALLAGCASTDYDTWNAQQPSQLASTSSSGARGASGASFSRTAAPGWDGRAASWSKLIEIEDWLNEPSYRRDEAFVGEAELQLAEGRLTLTRREMGRLNARLLTLRLDSAEAGFRRAMARPDLRSDQRQRAEQGLSDLGRLRHGQVGIENAGVAGGLQILNRDRWKAKAPVVARLTRTPRPYDRITVHHSAEHSSDLGRQSSSEVADILRRIQRFQMRDRGFGDIGYHFLIDPQGRIWQGRTMDWQGAHSNGDNNIANIGICLLGNYDVERPSDKSLRAMEKLIGALGQRHRIPRSRVYGHDHWKATECPGTHLSRWLASYKNRATPPRTAQ